MGRLQIFLTSLLITLAFTFSGCGSDNSDAPVSSDTIGTIPDITDTTDVSDLNESSLTVLLPVSSKTVTQNSELVSIEVRLFDGANNLYSDGEIKIVFPNDVRNGRDVGTFKDLSSNLTNGLATFEYTAPKNLSDNTNDIVFGFYHSANLSDVKQYTLTLSPDVNQTTLTTYSIKSSLVSGSLSMGLESEKVVSFHVVDDLGTQLDSDSITTISMTLLNTALAKIEYSGAENLTTVTMNDPTKNSLSVNLISSTKSGIVPIDVNATFLDADGNADSVSGTFNLVILSGPPTAMSIKYSGTTHDEENARFQDHMVIAVTDKYSNKVNTNPAVTASMIVGYAQEIAGNTKVALDSRIFFQTTDAKSATMNPTNNTLTSTATFTNIDLDNDILMTYGNGYTNSVSGMWNLNKNNVAMLATNTLEIEDEIPGSSNISNIGFAIGHNYRQDKCRDGEEWIATVELEGDTLDDNGIVKATINYDYYLVMKTIALGVDLVGFTADSNTTSKFGEMRKHTLRSTGITAVPDSCVIPKGTTDDCEFTFLIDGTDQWLRNANPDYTIVKNDKTSIDYNISKTYEVSTINQCVGKNDGGVVYVNINATAAADGAASIALDDILYGREF
ncbi:MAG: hypothetical protein OQJ77_05140 [Thiovulaceae bacterium]|nr:hypothetical protein [Sulfurimonadaceae bacterium]